MGFGCIKVNSPGVFHFYRVETSGVKNQKYESTDNWKGKVWKASFREIMWVSCYLYSKDGLILDDDLYFSLKTHYVARRQGGVASQQVRVRSAVTSMSVKKSFPN